MIRRYSKSRKRLHVNTVCVCVCLSTVRVFCRFLVFGVVVFFVMFQGGMIDSWVEFCTHELEAGHLFTHGWFEVVQFTKRLRYLFVPGCCQ